MVNNTGVTIDTAPESGPSGSTSARGVDPTDTGRGDEDRRVDFDGDFIPQQTLTGLCEVCNGEFWSFLGKQLHMRHAHFEILNAQRLRVIELAEGRKRGLDEYQKALIAKAEAEVEVEGVLRSGEVNNVLYRALEDAGAVMDEGMESKVRTRRKTLGHKEAVQRFILELRSRPAPTAPPPQDPDGQDITVPGGSFPYAYTGLFKAFFESTGEARLQGLWDSLDPTGICRDREKVDEFTKLKMEQWFSWSGNKPAPVGRRTSEPKPTNETRSQRKARLQRVTQQLFKKNPAACIKRILSNTRETETTVVATQQLTDYWSEVFSRQPEGVRKLDVANKQEMELLAHPLSVAEVDRAKERLRDNTPGPDGVAAKAIQKIDSQALCILFNVFLAAEHTPSWLREGVVTLVPKVVSPKEAADYRPITVCSQLLRCYHGILAQRG